VKNTASGNAVYNTATGSITLGGDPIVNGVIGQGSVSPGLSLSSSNPVFDPASGKKYTLDFNPYSGGSIAVKGGANFSANFVLKDPNWTFIIVGSDLMIKDNSVTLVPLGTQYIITGSGAQFTATRGSETVGTANQPIQTVLNAIRNEAIGVDIGIQFGDGSTELNIGAESAWFSGTWGLITLTGKITSTYSSTSAGTITTTDAVSVISTADIATTSYRAIYHNSTGTLTITGGTISVTSGVAVRNMSTGSVIISGGTVLATTGTAVTNAGGSVTILGTAKVTSANTSPTGGTVDGSTGTIIINGGTVENTAIAGNAVRSFSATIILGGNPTITGVIFRQYANLVLNVSGDVEFAPLNKVYTLGYYTSLPSLGAVIVTGGANFLDNFVLNITDRKLAVGTGGNANNLVIAANP